MEEEEKETKEETKEEVKVIVVNTGWEHGGINE